MKSKETTNDTKKNKTAESKKIPIKNSAGTPNDKRLQKTERISEYKNLALDADKWDVYTIIDFTAAFILVVISLVSAEIPRKRIEIVRRPAPYVATGWTPTGQQLNLPLKAPLSAYEPPAEPTTTELPTTTETTTTEQNFAREKSENVELEEPESEKVETVAPQQEKQGQFYVVVPQGQNVVLPQGQNIVYTVPRTAATVAVNRNELFGSGARLQSFPVNTGVFTPFSASYIQIYQ